MLSDFSLNTALLSHVVDNKYESEVKDMKLDKLASRERNALKRGVNPSTSWAIVVTRLINHWLELKKKMRFLGRFSKSFVELFIVG